MDPFGLMWGAAIIWYIADAVKNRKATAADRAAHIDSRRDARRTAGGWPLTAPRTSARFGSRLAAGLSSYPALAWMVPAEFFRGLRHGWLVGKLFRRNGGHLADARNQAADIDAARGRRVPGRAAPGRGSGTRPASGTGRGRTPTDPKTAGTGSATPDEVVDAELIDDDLTAAAPRSTTDPASPAGAPAPNGPDPEPEPSTDAEQHPEDPEGTPMTDITPTADISSAPATLADGGDYETVSQLAKHGNVLGEQLAELASELGRIFSSYASAAENIGAEAAGLRLDLQTQGDIANLETALAEARALRSAILRAADGIAESAVALAGNLARRHAGIRDAVNDSPVRSAHSEFYKDA